MAIYQVRVRQPLRRQSEFISCSCGSAYDRSLLVIFVTLCAPLVVVIFVHTIEHYWSQFGIGHCALFVDPMHPKHIVYKVHICVYHIQLWSIECESSSNFSHQCTLSAVNCKQLLGKQHDRTEIWFGFGVKCLSVFRSLSVGDMITQRCEINNRHTWKPNTDRFSYNVRTYLTKLDNNQATVCWITYVHCHMITRI